MTRWQRARVTAVAATPSCPSDPATAAAGRGGATAASTAEAGSAGWRMGDGGRASRRQRDGYPRAGATTTACTTAASSWGTHADG